MSAIYCPRCDLRLYPEEIAAQRCDGCAQVLPTEVAEQGGADPDAWELFRDGLGLLLVALPLFALGVLLSLPLLWGEGPPSPWLFGGSLLVRFAGAGMGIFALFCCSAVPPRVGLGPWASWLRIALLLSLLGMGVLFFLIVASIVIGFHPHGEWFDFFGLALFWEMGTAFLAMCFCLCRLLGEVARHFRARELADRFLVVFPLGVWVPFLTFGVPCMADKAGPGVDPPMAQGALLVALLFLVGVFGWWIRLVMQLRAVVSSRIRVG